MEKNFDKIIPICIAIILICIIFSPTAFSKEKEQKYIKNNVDFENNKFIGLEKENFNELKNKINNLIQFFDSEKKIGEKIIDIVSSIDQNEYPILREILDIIINKASDNMNQNSLLKKTFVISQGWSYNFNFFKKSEFEINRNQYSFWHYTKGSRNGGESKTLIIKPNNMFSSRSTEVYIGRQTGFMIRPIGIHIYQANMFPKASYSFFIGFANYIYANGEEKVQLNLPIQ